MLNSTSKGKMIGVILALIIILASLSLGPSGMAIATAPTKDLAATTLNAPVVNPDRTVTFTLRAPQANEVILNWQNMIGRSPAANPYPMTKDANGVWSITMGPLDPNWYSYGFIVDGLRIADPANRDIWSGATSAWSNVFVPGPEADYMAAALVPHGAVATERYFSNLTQTERQMQVYTPPGYNHDNRVYPVFYLLHGGGGNDTDWTVNMRTNYILDNLIAQGKAVPMIVVMPDTNVGPFGINTLVMQDIFPQELLGSIVPYIEENYRVAPGAKNRALAGLSMGNAHTRNTLLQEPGAFAYIGLFSLVMPQVFREDLVQNHEDLLTDPALNKQTKLLWITMGGPDDINLSGGAVDLAATLALLDQYHINYTYVPGPTFGAIYGHVWDTWRKDLYNFAPLLFK
jgi:enterochelin esterase-like enzyme